MVSTASIGDRGDIRKATTETAQTKTAKSNLKLMPMRIPAAINCGEFALAA